MLKRIIAFIMRHPSATLLIAGQLFTAGSACAEVNLQQQLQQCRQEVSALLRLDCYDQLLKPADDVKPNVIERSEIANKVLKQEQQRLEHSTDFLVTQAEGSISPEVIITTPALGATPPRPVLAFSCLDNITQMQIVMFEPIASANRTITLKTDTGAKLESYWFIRDNGYLLENSRGLPGIAQIQKLFNAETLHIESENAALNGLTFNVKNLSQAISPLRQACRW